jgi:hypothetical protein
MNKHIKQYKARSGVMMFKPSVQLIQQMDDDMQGFCLACGNVNDSVEPDAQRYECECCGEEKVYGASELALMGLCFDAEVTTNA